MVIPLTSAITSETRLVSDGRSVSECNEGWLNHDGNDSPGRRARRCGQIHVCCRAAKSAHGCRIHSGRVVRTAVQPGPSRRQPDGMVCRKEGALHGADMDHSLRSARYGSRRCTRAGSGGESQPRELLRAGQEAGYDLAVYLLDAPRDVRRDRVRQRNREKGPTFSMDVPDAFFELASDHWEPMDQTECEIYDVQVITWNPGSASGG